MIGIISIIIVALIIFCMIRESRVTGLYKAYGVYGRILAYLFVDGVTVALSSILMIVTGKGMDSFGAMLGIMVFGVALAAATYMRASRRCPDTLKKNLIQSMLISGLGVTGKIVFFFVGSLWKLITPREMVDEDGNTVYVDGNNVYDGSGWTIGHIDPDNPRRYIKTR